MEGSNFNEKNTVSDTETSVKSRNKKRNKRESKPRNDSSTAYEAEKAKIVGQIIARESQSQPRPSTEKKVELDPWTGQEKNKNDSEIDDEPKHGIKGKSDETVSETEAPEGELAESEKIDVYAELAQESHNERLSNGESIEQPPELSAALDQFDDLVIDQGMEPKQAADTILRQHGIEPSTVIEDEPNELPSSAEEAQQEPAEQNASQWRELSDEDEIKLNHDEAEASPNLEQKTVLTPMDINELGKDASDDNYSVLAGGSGGNNNPLRPTANSGGNGEIPLSPFGQQRFGPNPNTFPPASITSSKTEAPRQEYIEDRANPATMALFGGIIGYLIGRRRGRIKTEKKLLPIQKKLEKQVVDLQWDLKRQEIRVRKALTNKAEKPVVPHKQDLNKRLENPPIAAQFKSEKVEEFSPLFNKERPVNVDRKKAPEAQSLHGEIRTQEHLGQVLVAASEVAVTAPLEKEYVQELPNIKKEAKIDTPKMSKADSERRAETLSRSELLSISEKIDVDGTSLKQVYETHLIGEKGLRRLVSEHLSGGDLKKTLRKEIVEREIDFERDPAVRDMAISNSNTEKIKASSNGETLDQLIYKAESSLPANEELAFYKAKANYEVEQKQKQSQKRQVMDVGFLLAVTVLIAIIVLLFISRS
jgi:hypothetical protein